MLKRAGMQGDLPAAAEAVLALRDALLEPAAAAAPSLPPDLSAEQNEQWHATAAISAAEAGLAFAATAAATVTVVEAARTIAVAAAVWQADGAAAKAAPSCQICFEQYSGAVRVRSQCRSRNRATEYFSGSGMKPANGSTIATT